MLIYQPSSFDSDQNRLQQATSFLSQKLFPFGKIITAPSGDEPAHQLLRVGPVLVELQLYTRDLGDDAFEVLLKTATALEMKRKEQHDPSLLDIGICVLAHSFSRDFLARLPSGLIRVSVFEWEFIRSEKDDALLIREVKNGMPFDKPVSTKTAHLEISAAENQDRLIPQHPKELELSTPELVAFARFGMELRSRRSKSETLTEA